MFATLAKKHTVLHYQHHISHMIYNGKEASLAIQELLKAQLSTTSHKPVLVILSASTHKSVLSFIAIKKRFAEALGVRVHEYTFEESVSEETLTEAVIQAGNENGVRGIVAQLPLPPHIHVENILNAIPKHLDVDVLGENAWGVFCSNEGLTPPVAKAVEHILADTHTNIHGKNIVVIGQGRLVGAPVTQLLRNCGATPHIIDINTRDANKRELLANADIVISGIGVPHSFTKDMFKSGVVLIDAGTSEQFGKLAGDFHPECADVASVFTPVPGGVGPMTVAGLFENLVEISQKEVM